VGQDEGEHLDDEALLGHGVNAPGKHAFVCYLIWTLRM
jgi:hypothetical protein